KMGHATAAGLPHESLVIDPGIDFAKQRDDNLTVLRDLELLQRFGRPVLVPLSRKKVIGEVLGLADPRQRDAGTVACIVGAIAGGSQRLRDHNVEAAWQSVKVPHSLAVTRTTNSRNPSSAASLAGSISRSSSMRSPGAALRNVSRSFA